MCCGCGRDVGVGVAGVAGMIGGVAIVVASVASVGVRDWSPLLW